MISNETLKAVNNGILTDEAINHYTTLTDNLKCHGELYHVTWFHTFLTLETLNSFKQARKNKS